LDGFWIHRVLLSEGIESHVVDAASIATSRRRRRAKTDRSMARLCFARCWPTSAANRGSAQWFGRRRLKMKIAAGFAVSVRC
jgi:transposase